MTYKVVDETGVAMRLFQTLEEATQFLQEGWSIIKIPRLKKTKPNLFELLGEAPF
jgi:hypothetical protein